MKKKMKLSTMTIFFAMLLGFAVMCIGTEQACAMEGNGSKDNPYKISTYAELKEFAQIVNSGKTGACAILTADIECTDAKWEPIGTFKTPYAGTFDGNKHIIKELSNKDSARHDHAGFFGGIGTDGSVQNIGLEDASIHGERYVGLIAGTNQGSISNCHISGEVMGDGSRIGGVVGMNGKGTIESCFNAGDVSGIGDKGSIVGGMAGWNDLDGRITNCRNTGDISGSSDVGGVVGIGPKGTIQNCCNTGSVNGSGSDIGGVAGFTGAGMIINCYNTGDVNGKYYVGGIEGNSHGGAAITNCYNIGDISGERAVGGLVGARVQKSSKVTNCYSAGKVSGESSGGLSGLTFEDVMAYCYYDKPQSGCSAGDGFKGVDYNNTKGLTTEKMTGSGALNINNMVFVYGTGETSPWMVKANDTNAMYYPHLEGFNFDGEGKQMDPAAISAYKWPPRIDLIVAPPVFSPAAGEFGPQKKIKISSATRKATIFYTTDGTAPTVSSSKYTKPIVITDTTTIKAFAVKEEAVDSEMASATYTHIHKYGDWIKLNEEQHQRVCEHNDSHVEKESHTLETEWSRDGNGHWHECTVCQGKIDEAEHSWGAGKVTNRATTKAKGTKTYTCTVCKLARTETIPKLKTVTPLARMKAGKKSLAIAWNKVKGAAGYDIFFSRCNHSKKKMVLKNVKTIKGNKTFKWTKSGLKKGTAYKAYVKAYVMQNGKKTYVGKSPQMHAYTGNGTKKYTNAKSVKLKNVKKGKLTLKKGKVFKLKAKVNKIKKKKKLMPKSHAPVLRYMSSDKKIATVNSKGKIKAKAKGRCYIYAYAHNGVAKKVKVTVK